MEAMENVDTKEEQESGQSIVDSLNAMGMDDKNEVWKTIAEDPQVQSMVKEASLSFGGGSIKNESISFGSSNMLQSKTDTWLESSFDDLASKWDELLQGYAKAMGAESLSPEMEKNLKDSIAGLDSDNSIERAKARDTINILHSMMGMKKEEAIQQEVAEEEKDTRSAENIANSTDNSNSESTKKSLETKDVPSERETKVSQAISNIAEAKTWVYPINSPEWKQIKSSVADILNNSSLWMPDNLLNHNMVKVVNTPTGSECSLSSSDGKNVKVMFNKADATYKITQDGKEIGSWKSS